jgi:hypothetical protein
MNTKLIEKLVEHKSGAHPVRYSRSDVNSLADLSLHQSIYQYLRSCLPAEKYVASSVVVLPLLDILGAMGEDTSPGTYIRPFGYLITSTSLCGNAICFHNHSGNVFWCHHESFSRQGISYRSPGRREWSWFSEYTPENVQHAMVLLSSNIENFLTTLLTDQLTDSLGDLDC